MVDRLDFNELNQLVKDYLSLYGMDQTLEAFNQEERLRLQQVNNQQIAQRRMSQSGSKQVNKVP
jgi:hypothetical protein